MQDALASLAALGIRFQGVDLKFRRDGTDWPQRWRAECFSSKHETARHVAYGDTPELAIAALVDKVEKH